MASLPGVMGVPLILGLLGDEFLATVCPLGWERDSPPPWGKKDVPRSPFIALSLGKTLLLCVRVPALVCMQKSEQRGSVQQACHRETPSSISRHRVGSSWLLGSAKMAPVAQQESLQAP